MFFHKYNANAVTIDDIDFPSQLEANTYDALKTIHDLDAMQTLRLQVPYPLHGLDGNQVCRYELDFQVEFEDGALFAIESKGIMTSVASLKLKLFQSEYRLPLLIVRSKNLYLLNDIAIDLRLAEKSKRELIFRSWLNKNCKFPKKRTI